jgi:dihydroflavonol-4-reductase
MPMKVLVTGATGFIGGNLARALLEQGFEVRALVRETSSRTAIQDLDLDLVTGDLSNPACLDRALKGCDALFHAAAAYTFWSADPKSIYETNVQGTRNILDAALRAKITKVIYTSTESTIGISGHALGTEKAVASLESLSGHYKKSKLLAERVALAFCERGLPVTIVNPAMPVGPWDVKPTPSGQVVLDFLNGRMPAYVNTGLNVVDVRDVAQGHILALHKGRIGERYILGNRNMTLREILGVLEAITGIRASNVRIPIGLALGAAYVDEFVSGTLLKKPPRIPVSAVRTARKFRHFDCSKAINELGLPQTSIEQALADAVVWFRQHGYVRR